MPHKDKKYHIQYYEKNKEWIREYQRWWKEENKDKVKLQAKRARKRYYLRHHKELLERERKRRRVAVVEVLNYYGGSPPKCACCGESHIEFLTIDHIDGGGCAHRRSLGIKGGYQFSRWLVKNKFPSGYQVLCFNCNQCLGHYGYCPHEEEQDAYTTS